MDARESIYISLAIVGSTSLFASLLHLRRGALDIRVAATFGSAGIVGAYFGAKLTYLVTGRVLLLLFAALMLCVAMLMFKRSASSNDDAAATRKGSRALILGVGLAVGVLTGFLGVGGGFLVVPALVLLQRLPIHIAVGTSLLVIAMNSAAGFAGHMGEHELNLPLTAAFTAAAVIGALAGERAGRRVPAEKLIRLFACFIIAVAVFLIFMNYQAIIHS
jgi:uncharacterized membrane protein YfcA